MRKLYKSLVLATIPFIVAFVTYFSFPLFQGQDPAPLVEAFWFMVYHAAIDAVAIFIVANIIFEG